MLRSNQAQGRRLEEFWLSDFFGEIEGFERVQVKKALEVTRVSDEDSQ